NGRVEWWLCERQIVERDMQDEADTVRRRVDGVSQAQSSREAEHLVAGRCPEPAQREPRRVHEDGGSAGKALPECRAGQECAEPQQDRLPPLRPRPPHDVPLRSAIRAFLAPFNLIGSARLRAFASCDTRCGLLTPTWRGTTIGLASKRGSRCTRAVIPQRF